MQQKITREFTVGVDTYYKQSTNLIDEGQFGAPIILTPFNYRFGKQYGAEFTANYTTRELTAYLNFAAQSAKGKQIDSAQFNFAPEDLAYIRQQLHPPGSRAADDRVRRRVLSMARHALQRGFPVGLRLARGPRSAAGERPPPMAAPAFPTARICPTTPR